jgi:nucleotide-binding universal stress UspA family protein
MNPPENATGQRHGNITLALSLNSDAGMPLAFASRLAQERQASLTVMHVFGSGQKGRGEIARTQWAVTSRLPADRLREAELMCPLEIAVRRGDPAAEILKSGNSTNQDCIVLGPVDPSQPVEAGRSSIVHRVISEARCPVIVLGRSVADATGG